MIPGFVDLQINGWGGTDFSSPSLTADEVETACDQIVASGTAAFLPTVVTSSLETYRHVLPLLASVAAKRKGQVLGLHLEGPFLDPRQGARGCHREDLIRDPDVAVLDELLRLAKGTVRVLTVAAGRPGCAALIKAAVAAGVTVALGHQLASLDEIEEAADAGATFITHWGNGVPNQVHRHSNPLLAGLAASRLAATIITDGFHLPKAAVAAVLHAKAGEAGGGRPGVAVVSDAVWVAGLPEGTYQWIGKDIALEHDAGVGGFVVRDPTEKCLAGSAASMLQCANHLRQLGLLPPSWAPGGRDCLEDTVFHCPLRLIGLSEDDVVCPEPLVRFSDAEGYTAVARR